MNLTVISGRTTKDFETYTSKTGTAIAKSTVAVDSGFGDKKRTDFINVTAFGKTAEFCAKYILKGDMAEVVGHIVTGSYKKSDGTTIYTTDVNVDEIKKLSSSKPKEEKKGEFNYTQWNSATEEDDGFDTPF